MRSILKSEKKKNAEKQKIKLTLSVCTDWSKNQSFFNYEQRDVMTYIFS